VQRLSRGYRAKGEKGGRGGQKQNRGDDTRRIPRLEGSFTAERGRDFEKRPKQLNQSCRPKKHARDSTRRRPRHAVEITNGGGHTESQEKKIGPQKSPSKAKEKQYTRRPGRKRTRTSGWQRGGPLHPQIKLPGDVRTRVLKDDRGREKGGKKGDLDPKLGKKERKGAAIDGEQTCAKT